MINPIKNNPNNAQKLRILKFIDPIIINHHLSEYEINKREPNFEMLIQLAEYFEVTLDYLIVGGAPTKRE